MWLLTVSGLVLAVPLLIIGIIRLAQGGSGGWTLIGIAAACLLTVVGGIPLALRNGRL